MGRKREQASRKLNNRGMTLIEVLVAMMMLSVVSLVFLRSFSQTMFYNRNAREKQYALTVAQSMMEGVKAYGVENLDAQFDGTKTFRLYPSAAYVGKERRCDDDAGGKHQFHIHGIGLENSEFKFDVMIDVKPAVAEDSQINMVTTTPLVIGSDVNKYNDAIYMQEGREQDVVYERVVKALKDVPDMHNDAKNNLTKNTVDWSYVTLLITKRTLLVEIEPSTVTVKNVYDYSFDITDYPYRTASDPPGTVSGTCTTNGSGTVSDAGVECYNNSAVAGAKLENLYLYYYPAYKSTQGGYIKCDEDHIEIKNRVPGSDINVFVVKQRNVELSPAETQYCEGNYRAHVDLSGLSIPDWDTANRQQINLYHNLKEKLEGNGVLVYDCPNSSSVHFSDKGMLWEKNTVVPRTLVYDVTVTVREHVDTPPGGECCKGKVVYELSGTVNEK